MGNAVLSHSTAPSLLAPAIMFADLAAIAADHSKELDVAERTVRGHLRDVELRVEKNIDDSFKLIKSLIDEESRGVINPTDEELTDEIDWLLATEIDVKELIKAAKQDFHELTATAAREGAGRRDLLRVAGREYARIAGRLAAGLQEARWLLMGLRDGREPRDGGVVVSTPEELRRLLTTS